MTAAGSMIGPEAGAAALAQMREAAAVIVECRHWFDSRPRGLLGEIAAGEMPSAEWRHYPVGEVYDPCSHAQYFYHLHPAAQRAAHEHGHFHTFLRTEGIPSGLAPLVLPEIAVADAAPTPPQAAPLRLGARDEVCHLVAIALDQAGEPFRLFTTNRWVTGETWYRGADVVAMLDRFAVDTAAGSAVLNRWIGAVMTLFRPQIAMLLRARDETVMAWRRRQRASVFEDRRLEITSSVEIDLPARLASLAGAPPPADPAGWPRPSDLPAMAEGWGEDHAG